MSNIKVSHPCRHVNNSKTYDNIFYFLWSHIILLHISSTFSNSGAFIEYWSCHLFTSSVYSHKVSLLIRNSTSLYNLIYEWPWPWHDLSQFLIVSSPFGFPSFIVAICTYYSNISHLYVRGVRRRGVHFRFS